MRALLAEGIRYFLGACVGLSVDWGVWSIAVLAGGPPVMAQCLGKAAGAGVAFHAYRRHVFTSSPSASPEISSGASEGMPEENNARGQAQRFVLAAAAGWLVSITVFSIGSMMLPPIAAKVCSDGITFTLNWAVMRYWVFRPGDELLRVV